jgi:hypothetical protein
MGPRAADFALGPELAASTYERPIYALAGSIEGRQLERVAFHYTHCSSPKLGYALHSKPPIKQRPRKIDRDSLVNFEYKILRLNQFPVCEVCL